MSSNSPVNIKSQQQNSDNKNLSVPNEPTQQQANIKKSLDNEENENPKPKYFKRRQRGGKNLDKRNAIYWKAQANRLMKMYSANHQSNKEATNVTCVNVINIIKK